MELLPSALFILFIVLFQKAAIPVNSTEIHSEKYFCGSEDHSSITRTLILSPNDKYLSSELLINITGKIVPTASKSDSDF